MDSPQPDTLASPVEVTYFPSDWRAEAELVTRITYALGDVRDEAPDRLDTGIDPLIDFDAIPRLFEGADGGAGSVSLHADDETVQVNDDGSIVVLEAQA